MALTDDFLIFRLCENQQEVQCLFQVLSFTKISCTVHHMTTLRIETQFSMRHCLFHKFTTNGTTRNQRCVAFSWLSVKQLRDLNSDIRVTRCISARMYIYITVTGCSDYLVA